MSPSNSQLHELGESAVGILPAARFREVVERERQRARRHRRDLSLCIFETRGGGWRELLARLGRHFLRSARVVHVGWLGEGRLCILVEGAREKAETLARRLGRLNQALAGPPIQARVWVYPHARQEGSGAPAGHASDGPPVETNGRAAAGTGDRPWSLPMCW